MVQVSTETMTVVAHIGAMEDPTTLPASLVRVLEDARVVKAGVGIGLDAAELKRWFQVRVEGAVDVGWAAVLLRVGREWTGQEHSDLDHVGLKTLVRAFGVHMPKGQAMSNWRRHSLSDAQVEYAARDAYAGVWALRNLFHARVEPLARLGGVEGGRPAPGMHAWALSLVGKFSLKAHLAAPGPGLELRRRCASDIGTLMLRNSDGLNPAGPRRHAWPWAPRSYPSRLSSLAQSGALASLQPWRVHRTWLPARFPACPGARSPARPCRLIASSFFFSLDRVRVAPFR